MVASGFLKDLQDHLAEITVDQGECPTSMTEERHAALYEESRQRALALLADPAKAASWEILNSADGGTTDALREEARLAAHRENYFTLENYLAALVPSGDPVRLRLRSLFASLYPRKQG